MKEHKLELECPYGGECEYWHPRYGCTDSSCQLWKEVQEDKAEEREENRKLEAGK